MSTLIETGEETESYTWNVLSAQGGDREAFDRLAQRYQGLVYSIVLRRVRNHAEALEVSQEVFIRAWRKLDQLREPERFPAWLKQVAVRMSINHVLRRKAETALDNGEFSSVEEVRVASPLTNLMKSETAHEVWDCLDKLREMDRQTLVAFYFEGRSLRQMSDLFDSPVGTIKRRLHTARNRLKTELAGTGTIG